MPVMFLLAAVIVVSVAPARATPATNHDGSILLSAVAPDLPKRAYNSFGSASNGYIGYVFQLASGADGQAYTLTRTGPSLGNPDVYFYTQENGQLGTICNPSYSEDGLVPLGNGYLLSNTETGTICPGSQVARYAVVLLFSGSNVSFRLSY